ncbi:MAG: T9SS type A sorting domain-containing protein [Candidatus Kapaibacterium sp.]
MRLLCALILGSSLLFSSFATQASTRTGSFDTTITFIGKTRLLSCYVPTKYNDTNKYRLMVCLHGLGDNSANYRNALISSLGWATDFPNTIFVCPEAAATTDDFYQFAGDETIVDTCIKFAMANYHIDSSDVILQGFSLGGRAALRYGLDNYRKFKALLLNTPAIQGVKNALNGQPSYLYTYANASRIPIYITHGVQDVFYEPPIDSAIKQMVLNDGIVRYTDVPNIAHTIPSFSKMSDALQFFNAPAHVGNDVELFELDAPARVFSPSIPSQALIQNVGNDTVALVSFQVAQGTMSSSYLWTGLLLPFQHAMVTLPAPFVESGSLENLLDVRIDSINGSADTIASNNEKLDTFQLISQGSALPFSEGFEESEFPPPGWLLQLAGDIQSPWFQDTVRQSGAFSAGAFNSIFYFDNSGRAEGLLSPVLDLTSTPNPQLSFDIAYNYDRYTPPYTTGGTVDLTDTLEILISTDGGVTYSSLFRKAGAELATFAAPIHNPSSAQAVIITPQDSNWRHYTIDLTPYSSAPEAFLKFNYISGLGGSIYIDNVNVGLPLAVQASAPISYHVFPNPASDRVTIVGDAVSKVQVAMLDVAGREVLSSEGMTDGSGSFVLDTHHLIAGVYLVRVNIGQHSTTMKLVIQR